MLHVGHARQTIRKLRKVCDAAGSFQLAAAREVFHQRDHVDGLLLLAKLDHALEYLAMLRQEEILGADFFDGSVQRVVIQQNRAENAALGLEIIRKRAFDSGVSRHN